jgi:hypothetical protein
VTIGRDVLDIMADPLAFMLRLTILNERNERQRLTRLWEEQEAYARALTSGRRIVIAVKPRQVGFTTLALAWFFWKTFRSEHPRRVLTTVHEPDAMQRAVDIVREFHGGLPPELRAWVHRGELRTGLQQDSKKRTKFGHNGGIMDRLLAGASGQGRSGTLNDYHATEVAFYPVASSATRSMETGTQADQDLLASISSSMHDPTGQIVLESTGNGPSGLFHALVMRARELKDASLVFVPWFAVGRYVAPVPPGMGAELEPEEVKLMVDHGVSLEQLAWRRHKLTSVAGMNKLRFRKEYPSNLLDPFILESEGWFRHDALTSMEAAIPARFRDMVDEERVFYPPEEGRAYFIGADSAGGVGLDEAGCSVMRDDQVEAACWQSRFADVPMQAKRIAQLFGLYRMNGKNRVVVMVEANKYGIEVINRLEALGVTTWKDPEGHDWYSTGGNSGSTKRRLMVYCKEEVDGLRTVWNDPDALLQAGNIVEKPNGKIEARVSDGRRRGVKDHDDRVIMRALALWAGRNHVQRLRKVDPVAARHEANLAAMKADDQVRRRPWT